MTILGTMQTALTEIKTVSGELIEAPATSQNPAAVYLAKLAKGSRPTMRGALDSIATLLAPGTDAETCPWAQLRYQHTQAIRAKLAAKLAPATASKQLCALRGVLKEAWRLGLMPAEDYHRAADIEGVKGSRLPAGRALDRGELTALFAACAADKTPAGVRDAAMLALLYACGLRRFELAALAVADYEADRGELAVYSGKGNKDRLAYVTNGAKAALDRWLTVRGAQAGALFVPIRKDGKLADRPLTPHALWKVLGKRAAQAGVKTLSPHDLRRTFISDLLDNGADLSVVQQLAGHANIQTTQRYDRRPAEARRRASALLHVPIAA